VVYCCTENEAARLGRLIYEILGLVQQWRSSRAIYEKELFNTPGFKLKYDDPMSAGCPFPQFIIFTSRLYLIMVKVFGICLQSKEYMDLRNALVVLTKIVKYFHLKKIGAYLENKVVKIKSDEREDLKILASRYHALLEQQKKLMVTEEEFNYIEGVSPPKDKSKAPPADASKKSSQTEESNNEPTPKSETKKDKDDKHEKHEHSSSSKTEIREGPEPPELKKVKKEKTPPVDEDSERASKRRKPDLKGSDHPSRSPTPSVNKIDKDKEMDVEREPGKKASRTVAKEKEPSARDGRDPKRRKTDERPNERKQDISNDKLSKETKEREKHKEEKAMEKESRDKEREKEKEGDKPETREKEVKKRDSQRVEREREKEDKDHKEKETKGETKEKETKEKERDTKDSHRERDSKEKERESKDQHREVIINVLVLEIGI